MEVFIRDPDCVIEVGMNDYVSHLKQKVVQETGLAVQALLLEGVRLPEEELCCCTDLVDGSVLDLEIKLDVALLRKTWLASGVDVHRVPSQLWTDTVSLPPCKHHTVRDMNTSPKSFVPTKPSSLLCCREMRRCTPQ